MASKDGLKGTLDSLRDKLSSIFGGGSSAATPPASRPPAASEAVRSLCGNLGITRQEAEDLLRKCGINPSVPYLTQEQTTAVYQAHYSGAIEEDDNPPEKSKPSSTGRVKKEAVKIPPSELIRDYSADFDAAKEKYRGVRLAFTGTVEMVRKDGGNNFAVEMTSDDPAFHGKVVCRFVQSMKPKLDELGLGQEATIAGWISGTDGIVLSYGNDTITIGNCVISPSVPTAQKAPSPAQNSVKDTVSVRPSVMIRDYSADFEAARQKYAGSKLTFTGAVELVRKDGENNFAVEIIPDDHAFSGRVICKFVNNMKPRLQKLVKGQKVTISGYMTGGEEGLSLQPGSSAITVANSIIVSEAPAPRVPHKVRIFPMTDIPETVIPRVSVPAEGSPVYTQDGREYILGDAVGHGGEGTV